LETEVAGRQAKSSRFVFWKLEIEKLFYIS